MTSRADAHIHLFEHGYVPGRLPSEVDAYERIRAEHDVGAALVVGYEGEQRFGGNNDYILELARERDWVRPLAYVPAEPPAAGRLSELRDRGFVGWAVYLPDAAPSLEQWPAAVIDELSSSAGVLSLNASPAALARVHAVLAGLRDTTVLLSHLGLPGRALAAGAGVEVLAPVLELARHPHVYVKLSGLYAIDPVHPSRGAEPVVSTILDAVGADRLVWGSDFTPALGAMTEDQLMVLPPWLESMLTPDQLDQILHSTLERVISSSTPRPTATPSDEAVPHRPSTKKGRS